MSEYMCSRHMRRQKLGEGNGEVNKLSDNTDSREQALVQRYTWQRQPTQCHTTPARFTLSVPPCNMVCVLRVRSKDCHTNRARFWIIKRELNILHMSCMMCVFCTYFLEGSVPCQSGLPKSCDSFVCHFLSASCPERSF